jgi:hypothetical protein
MRDSFDGRTEMDVAHHLVGDFLARNHSQYFPRAMRHTMSPFGPVILNRHCFCYGGELG